MNAAQQIRADLATEAQVRSRRGYALLVAWGAAAVGLALVLKPRPDLGPPDAMAQAIAAAFILFGASVSFSPNLRFGRWSARAIGVVAILSPLFAARAIGASDTILGGTLKCMGVITAIGFVTLVVGRLILGRTRRRFGGGPVASRRRSRDGGQPSRRVALSDVGGDAPRDPCGGNSGRGGPTSAPHLDGNVIEGKFLA